MSSDSRLQRQCVDTIFMVRPVAFGFNPDAAKSNVFMASHENDENENIRTKAQEEFDAFAGKLKAAGVHVIMFEDSLQPHTPDSLFPNNWFDSDREGMVIIYPMNPENRRYEHEKGRAYVKDLQTKHGFKLNRVVDLTPFEDQGKFLEGTGSMVFDCINKIAYACLSPRTHQDLLDEFAKITGYEVITFTALGDGDVPVYHNNLVMSVGSDFAVICAESIKDPAEQEKVLTRLKETDHEIIEITTPQMNAFAGNILQVMSQDGESILAMSEGARNAFTEDQITTLEKYARIVSSPLPTIEKHGGGSARCMMAEVFLPKS